MLTGFYPVHSFLCSSVHQLPHHKPTAQPLIQLHPILCTTFEILLNALASARVLICRINTFYTALYSGVPLCGRDAYQAAAHGFKKLTPFFFTYAMYITARVSHLHENRRLSERDKPKASSLELHAAYGIPNSGGRVFFLPSFLLSPVAFAVELAEASCVYFAQ